MPTRCISVHLRISAQTGIISLSNNNWTVSIIETVCLLRGTDWIINYNSRNDSYETVVSEVVVVVAVFFFHCHYSPLWALACRTISFHFPLSITNSLHLLTPSTWRSRSTFSFHPFLGLPLRLVPSSSWVKIFLGILSSSILSRWPNQLILCPFIHFTIFSPLLISSSSRFVLLFHSSFSHLSEVVYDTKSVAETIFHDASSPSVHIAAL